MDNKEINARYFEAYAQEKGIDLYKAGNLHCINPNAHTHGDKNASMTYYADSHKLFCHGEQRSYDIFDLVKMYENVADDKEAKKFICDKYNIHDISYIQDNTAIKYKQNIPKDTKVIQFNPNAQQMNQQQQEQTTIKIKCDFTSTIQEIYDRQTEADKQHFKDRRTYRRNYRKI